MGQNLKEVNLAAQSNLEYNPVLNRLAYLESMTHLVVTPELHTNMIKFMGMTKPHEYLAYNTIEDKFFALKHTSN